MKRITCIFILFFSYLTALNATASTIAAPQVKGLPQIDANLIFQDANLDNKLNYYVFKQAVTAYNKLKYKRKPLLTVIDYTKPSTEKRFFVIDLVKRELIYNTYVAHGVNTGGNIAKNFSNRVNSRTTSLGVFLTSTTYYGGNGYSLKLDGLSPGMNDNARKRYIVVHGADYATEQFIQQHGRLGRSWGCPALPRSIAREVIDMIKDGSVIYAYG